MCPDGGVDSIRCTLDSLIDSTCPAGVEWCEYRLAQDSCPVGISVGPKPTVSGLLALSDRQSCQSLPGLRLDPISVAVIDVLHAVCSVRPSCLRQQSLTSVAISDTSIGHGGFQAFSARASSLSRYPVKHVRSAEGLHA